MTPLGRYMLETLIALGVVAALSIAVLYAARRTGVGRPTGPLQLAGRLLLDARRAVYLIRVGETVYLVGASEAGLSKLGELPATALGVTEELLIQGPSPGFSQILERVLKRRTPGQPREEGSTEREPEGHGPEPR